MKLAMHRYALAASALALSLQGCASGGSEPAAFNIRPAPTATSSMSARDGLYASATGAINRGDYAYALDLLQAARGRGGEDARILNAFAVVYDKLGRFDLSQRYYGAARALDPNSKILAQNLAYSQVLQGKGAAPVALTAAERPAAPVAVAATAPSAPVAVAPVMAAPVAVSPVGVVTAATTVVARADRPKAAPGDPVRPTPTLTTPPTEPSPTRVDYTPSAAAAAPRVVARTQAPPWDAPAILQPTTIAPTLAPVRVTAAAAAPKVQPRKATTAAPLRSAAASASARPAPHRIAANTPTGLAPAARAAKQPVRTASVARPAAAPHRVAVAQVERQPPRAAERRAPAAKRGWTLAAANEQVARVLSRGLRFLEDLERCRSGCSKVTVPLDAKPTLRVTDMAPGGPPYMS